MLQKRRGVTRIELAVVTVLAVVVVGLVLPAVQAARSEAALKASQDNLRKIGQATLTYEQTVGRLPYGTFHDNNSANGSAHPEFGADGVAARMNKAAAVEKADPTTAAKLYREAFDAARDFNQCFALAQRLKALDIAVDSLTRLGVVCDWMVLGPFDDPEEKGYAAAFAPEKGIDLKATYEGLGGKIAWKRFTSDARDGWIDLVKVVGPRDAAVAYAYTVVTCPKDQEVELRASSDDNLAV